MKRVARFTSTFALLAALSVVAAHSQTNTPQRPKITGFAHVAIYVTDAGKATHFYRDILGYAKSGDNSFDVNSQQALEIEPAPKGTQDLISHVAFATDNAEGMRAYLQSKGVKVPDKVSDGRNGAKWFALTDPAGQPIEFIEEKAHGMAKPATPPASKQIIHVGFVVRDREAEEHFYKDILGFRPYWHGGMEPNRTDWVALQVPDGTVWIEEMLGVSEHPNAQELGVLNHFALGVDDIKTVIPNLKQHGWTPTGDDGHEAELGKDGKMQFDIFDPDLTRVEYMSFKPVQKPCCSDFTGPHPHD
jgi:catechol 2,3-dioxygenase-like lactoylglutathione lyase family enzyme